MATAISYQCPAVLGLDKVDRLVYITGEFSTQCLTTRFLFSSPVLDFNSSGVHYLQGFIRTHISSLVPHAGRPRRATRRPGRSTCSKNTRDLPAPGCTNPGAAPKQSKRRPGRSHDSAEELDEEMLVPDVWDRVPKVPVIVSQQE
ncbi:hypothetical protein BJV78DRAFT_1155840 [Lactifluus subvellereus]|nr:hypothetical protein BJV78DRAFT_1155840 [Lactifluus subvellereus]